MIFNRGLILADFRRHCAKYTLTIPIVKRKKKIVLVKALVAKVGHGLLRCHAIPWGQDIF